MSLFRSACWRTPSCTLDVDQRHSASLDINKEEITTDHPYRLTDSWNSISDLLCVFAVVSKCIPTPSLREKSVVEMWHGEAQTSFKLCHETLICYHIGIIGPVELWRVAFWWVLMFSAVCGPCVAGVSGILVDNLGLFYLGFSATKLSFSMSASRECLVARNFDALSLDGDMDGWVCMKYLARILNWRHCGVELQASKLWS